VPCQPALVASPFSLSSLEPSLALDTLSFHPRHSRLRLRLIHQTIIYTNIYQTTLTSPSHAHSRVECVFLFPPSLIHHQHLHQYPHQYHQYPPVLIGRSDHPASRTLSRAVRVELNLPFFPFPSLHALGVLFNAAIPPLPTNTSTTCVSASPAHSCPCDQAWRFPFSDLP
jgi:hypothetical protein